MRTKSAEKFIVFRARSGNKTSNQIAKIGLVAGGKVHTHNGTAVHGILWNPRGVPLENVDYVRDATPREVALGISIH